MCSHRVKIAAKKSQDDEKGKLIHALQTALVTMTARLEMHQEAIEELMAERLMYCAVAPREIAK